MCCTKERQLHISWLPRTTRQLLLATDHRYHCLPVLPPAVWELYTGQIAFKKLQYGEKLTKPAVDAASQLVASRHCCWAVL